MQPSDPQFRLPPFPAFPSVSRFVALGSIADTMSRISRSIDAREGVSLVIGPPGTGKSLVCALIVDEYRETHDVVVLGETPIEDQAAFLRHLLHHLGADFGSIPERDLQLTLIDRVCDPESPAGGLLIVVDEAQSMSADVLESIRMVTNIMRDGEPRVYAVVCGGVKLDETLSSPSMEAFAQRVATRCYLHPLSGEETRHYICETITRCGAEPEDTITDEAIAAVHHACNGVPRLLNHMLTQAIDCAEEADQELITEQVIDQAWAELQQLPSPMVEEPSLVHNSQAIEFGELDESNDDISHASHESPHTQAVEYSELSDETQADPCDDACLATSCDPATCEKEDCQQGQCSLTASHVSDHVVEDDVESEAEAVSIEMATDHCVESTEVDEHNVTTETLVPPSAALFGEFEEEEEVVVGSGVLPGAQVTSQEPVNDIESMLHQEIVSIASAAAEQTAVAEDYELSPSTPEVELTSEPGESEFTRHATENDIEISDEDCHWADEPEVISVVPSPPVLWLDEAGTGDQDGDDEQDLRISDDQDLLVIEDDVDIAPASVETRVDSQEQTISVDFQAMLARMRSGT